MYGPNGCLLPDLLHPDGSEGFDSASEGAGCVEEGAVHADEADTGRDAGESRICHPGSAAVGKEEDGLFRGCGFALEEDGERSRGLRGKG